MKRGGRRTRKPPPITQAEYALLAGFRGKLREFIRFSETAALAAGLPPHQHQALLVIRGLSPEGAMTVGELAAHLRIKHQSAVGLVNRMVAGGLAVKGRDAADARQVRVRLTPGGERILANLSAAHKAEIARLGPVLRRILDRLKAGA
jgi:DNA-binding MarR family transcriptional regulator